MNLRVLFLFFMSYSFVGWIIEMLVVAMEKGRFTPRGFLIGPYLPIFGVGAILITLFLTKYQNDVIVLFIMSAFLGAILEYIVSYVLEKIFKTRWWNYEKDRFNLNGRVCLSTTIGFGILGVLVIVCFNPIFFSIINSASLFVQTLLATLFAIIFFVDVIVSFNVISKIKLVDFGKGRDTTEEVTNKVREVLKKHSFLSKRLVNAFPDLKVRKK